MPIPSVLFLLALLAGVPAAAEDDGLLRPDVAWAQAEEGDLLIIDIRTEGEWEETGIPPDSELVSLYNDWSIPEHQVRQRHSRCR